MTLAEHFKTKFRVLIVFLFPKRGKDLCHYTRGVHCKTLEMYNVKALEVSVLLLKLEVFMYVLFIQVLEILCV